MLPESNSSQYFVLHTENSHLIQMTVFFSFFSAYKRVILLELVGNNSYKS